VTHFYLCEKIFFYFIDIAHTMPQNNSLKFETNYSSTPTLIQHFVIKKKRKLIKFSILARVMFSLCFLNKKKKSYTKHLCIMMH